MKGRTFIDSEKFKRLPINSQILLRAQNKTQEQYAILLNDRICLASRDRTYIDYFDFGTAVNILRAGGAVRRAGWNGKGMFVVRQELLAYNGSNIDYLVLLPDAAKRILKKRDSKTIMYKYQLMIVNKKGEINSWAPSAEDIFSEDWEIVE